MKNLKQKFLIVVGLPKSGTTFLYSQLKELTDKFNIPTDRKEIDFFRGQSGLNAYLSEFTITSENGVFLDCSPLYIDQITDSINNISETLKDHEVRIVVCLRDPIERAFSHYLHDVAQHQKLLAHADYNFFSPSVMAKYFYPVSPRVAALKKAFGNENVLGFSFSQDNSAFANMLRVFAGLPDDWNFDYSSNPAPGFTSPQTFYHPTQASTIMLEGEYYRIEPGELLAVNRQYSLYRKKIHCETAQSIMCHQASITRQINTDQLPPELRNLVGDDFDSAMTQLDMVLPQDRSDRVYAARVSESVTDQIKKQLNHVGSVADVTAELFSHPLRPTPETTMALTEHSPSFAQEMARLSLNIPGRTEQIRRMIAEFGPVPMYMQYLVDQALRNKSYDAALALLESYGSSDAFMYPVVVRSGEGNAALPDDIKERAFIQGVLYNT
ncbi:Sulfotransferase domain-containing protein [Jannaschia faecimaris]|uniref:Sulfotransferase domain-containing protein n=1 Tax=Jannaschia faecimaris TaxID=1244108 RepID=A0A1H3KAR9_9RHOB|nr:sulfotransferase domain-containing protein [Jannaschia faecimaris]SDY49240.1 Sulfotransferase domain-containing protein [Jannaschia faecimaris]